MRTELQLESSVGQFFIQIVGKTEFNDHVGAFYFVTRQQDESPFIMQWGHTSFSLDDQTKMVIKMDGDNTGTFWISCIPQIYTDFCIPVQIYVMNFEDVYTSCLVTNNRINQLEGHVLELENKLDEIYYSPNMPGYFKAEQDFNQKKY